MKESDYTPYIDNRAILYQKTLRSQFEMENIVSNLEFNQELQMLIYNDYNEVIGSVPINDTFLEGHKRIVKSLEQDLISQGEVGRQLQEDILMEIEREYWLSNE